MMSELSEDGLRHNAQQLREKADELEKTAKEMKEEKELWERLYDGLKDRDPLYLMEMVWENRKEWFLGPEQKVYEYRYVKICGGCKKVVEHEEVRKRGISESGYCYRCSYTMDKSFMDHIMELRADSPLDAMIKILKEEDS